MATRTCTRSRLRCLYRQVGDLFILLSLYSFSLSRFVQLVRKHLPRSLLHFEDFGVSNAQRLLSIYRDKHAVFNDDVYGMKSLPVVV